MTEEIPFAQGVSPSHYFFNRATFATGSSPQGVALADMNGDGRMDLIVADQKDRKVSILLGQPDGSYGIKNDYPLSDYCYGVAAGDFNRDGKMDVAVTTTTGIEVMLGNGDGTLRSPVFYPVQLVSYLIQAVDMNGDGKLDLVDAGYNKGYENNVAVLLGNGDGTFKPEKDTVVNGQPIAMAIMDLNGDGKPDVALANWSNYLSPDGGPGFVAVLLGKGDGTFSKPWYGPNTFAIYGIAAGEVTGDKIPDLVVSHVFSPTMTVMKGNGDGTFQPEQGIASTLEVGSEFVQVLDVNGDGNNDIVTNDYFNQAVGIYLGNGDGTFQPPQSYITGGYYYFATGDVNGDGIPDVAMSAGAGVTVLLGNGDGSFSPRTNLPIPQQQPLISSATFADFNGDGKLDIAAGVGGAVDVLLNNGEGGFAAPVSTGWIDAQMLSSAGAADFNHDGHMDLIASGNLLLLGRGDGSFHAPVQFNNEIMARGFAVGDFNNDGNADVVVVGSVGETQPIQLYLGNGDGTFQPVRRFWNLKDWAQGVVVSDFNRDGNLDLAIPVNPNGIAIMLGDGKGNFANPVIYPTDDLPNGVVVADLNKDGIPDLIAPSTFNVNVLLGKGNGKFQSYVLYNSPQYPVMSVGVGDFNGDGKPDVAVNAGSGVLEIYFGNGDGTLQAPFPFMATGLGQPVVTGDLNGDKIDDILIPAGNGSLFMSAPFVSLSPSQLNFGTLPTGAQSASLPIRVTNVGLGPLDVNGATVGAPFSVTNPVCPAPVHNEASCTIETSVLASTAGTDNGQIMIESNARNTPLAVPVTVTAYSRATPVITWASPAAIPYGTALSATQLDAKSSVAGTFTYSPAPGKVLSAGTQTLSVTFTPTDIAHYASATDSVTLVVKQATPKIAWANPAAIAYGTALSKTQLNATSGTAGTLVYSPSLGAVLAAGSQLLSVTLNPTDTVDFTTATATVKITVVPAVLTVIAANVSRSYGAANPPFTASITGFVNGDTLGSAVTGAPALATRATASSPAGTYPILVSAGSLSAANYTFKFVAGTLSITRATLTVTANSASVAYNQPIPKLSYNATGFVNGDASSVVSGAPSETTTARKGSAVGTYPITITQGTLAAANYNFQFVAGTLTITALGTTATPAFRPTPGSFNSSVTVTLTDATTGALDFYTTNGTTPTTSSLQLPAAGLKVSATTTVTAIAVAPGYNPSAPVAATYTIATAPTVTTAPATGISTPDATLNGAVAANDATTQYWFAYGTSKTALTSATSKTGALTGTTSSPFSARLTALKGKTTYYFQAVASNAAGTTSGSVLSFTTN